MEPTTSRIQSGPLPGLPVRPTARPADAALPAPLARPAAQDQWQADASGQVPLDPNAHLDALLAATGGAPAPLGTLNGPLTQLFVNAATDQLHQTQVLQGQLDRKSAALQDVIQSYGPALTDAQRQALLDTYQQGTPELGQLATAQAALADTLKGSGDVLADAYATGQDEGRIEDAFAGIAAQHGDLALDFATKVMQRLDPRDPNSQAIASRLLTKLAPTALAQQLGAEAGQQPDCPLKGAGALLASPFAAQLARFQDASPDARKTLDAMKALGHSPPLDAITAFINQNDDGALGTALGQLDGVVGLSTISNALDRQDFARALGRFSGTASMVLGQAGLLKVFGAAGAQAAQVAGVAGSFAGLGASIYQAFGDLQVLADHPDNPADKASLGLSIGQVAVGTAAVGALIFGAPEALMALGASGMGLGVARLATGLMGQNEPGSEMRDKLDAELQALIPDPNLRYQLLSAQPTALAKLADWGLKPEQIQGLLAEGNPAVSSMVAGEDLAPLEPLLRTVVGPAQGPMDPGKLAQFLRDTAVPGTMGPAPRLMADWMRDATEDGNGDPKATMQALRDTLARVQNLAMPGSQQAELASKLAGLLPPA